LVSVGVLAVLVAAPEARAQGLKLTGYADLEWVATQTDDPADEWHHFFDNHHFNLIGLAWVTDDLSGGVEVEYEHAGQEIALEYGYIAYVGIPHVRLVGGKFIVPFNRWNRDVHPTFISKMPDRPIVYNNVFPATYSDVGFLASGAGAVGNGSRITYDAYVVNGLKGDADATNFRDLTANDRERPDRDDNKAVGGRLGVEFPLAGFGISAYTGDYAKTETDGLGISFLGLDGDVHWQGLELRGEYVRATQDLTTGDENERSGYYLQASYATQANLEPVIRFSSVDFEEASGDARELGIGVNYFLSASGTLRVGYYFEMEDEEEFEKDNNKFLTQFVVVF
jgi:hypothetical protein